MHAASAEAFCAGHLRCLAKDLKAGLIRFSNDVPNYYVLNFRPTSLTPGLHALHLQIKDGQGLALKARSEYWIDGDPVH